MKAIVHLTDQGAQAYKGHASGSLGSHKALREHGTLDAIKHAIEETPWQKFKQVEVTLPCKIKNDIFADASIALGWRVKSKRFIERVEIVK